MRCTSPARPRLGPRRGATRPVDRRRSPPPGAVLTSSSAGAVWADIAARTALQPQELPIGIITALVGAPFLAHGILGAALYEVIAPVARRLGLQPFFDDTGLHRTIDDYRRLPSPDQQYVRPEVVTDRGTGPGADLVIELRSPDDETYAKLDWDAGMNVREVLVIDVETRVPQLFVTVDGRPLAALPGEDGAVRSQVLGATFTVVGGPRLRVGTPSGDAEV